MKKNKKDKFQPYFDELKKVSKNAPSDEEILNEFEKGNFSSIDPDFFKTGHDMASKFLREQKKECKVEKIRKKGRDVSV